MTPYYETSEGLIYKGDALDVLRTMPEASVHMRNEKGQIVGGHWRSKKPYWDKSWLQHQYTMMCKSANQIAKEQGCKENNILYFLAKHEIPRRTMQQIRQSKHWGLRGEQNGMFGRYGDLNPNWKGGITPERQELYCSQEWTDVVQLVWKRDHAECQKCNTQKTNDNEFHIHHLVAFEIVELRRELSNLVLLCKECHNWVHSKKNERGEYIGAVL